MTSERRNVAEQVNCIICDSLYDVDVGTDELCLSCCCGKIRDMADDAVDITREFERLGLSRAMGVSSVASARIHDAVLNLVDELLEPIDDMLDIAEGSDSARDVRF